MYKISFILIFLLKIGWVQKYTPVEFEGVINLTKQTMYDTTLISFIVKHNMVRIDEKNTRNEIIQSLIINTSAKIITALSPSQKLYTNIYKNRASQLGDIKIIKTTNFKYINGYKCTLWRVRNNTLNTEVSLWVCTENFTFYSEVMNLLSKTEDYSKYCNYFNMIPGNSEYFQF